MSNKILAVNAGSSSVKFALFSEVQDLPQLQCVSRGVIELIEDTAILRVEQQPFKTVVPNDSLSSRITENTAPLVLLYQWLKANGLADHITVVCHRVVHGADCFHQPVILNTSILEKLHALVPMAPLHQPFCLAAIKQLCTHFPSATHIACFDTAFHKTMPREAKSFAIPRKLHDKGVKPYGFHGLSYQYIATKLESYFDRHGHKRVIVAHLGSGSSLCALQQGKSQATSMTFSPLEGLPMATRCGSIDPAAIIYMLSVLNMSADEISQVLHKQSGLLGLSTLSGDIRELLCSKTDSAEFSVEYFVYQVCKEIGAMAAVLEGLDALVFTGGIGFHQWKIRQAICHKLQWLGIEIDHDKNQENDQLIHTRKSKADILTLKTDEEWMMATNALTLIREAKN